MSDTVVDLLRRSLGALPATERRVALRLLGDYPMAGLSSASELARTVGVSTPSVLRLTSRLGFGSYADFQAQLREELAAQLSTPLNKVPADGEGAAGDAWRGFAEAVIANLRETFEHLAGADLEQITRLLADTRLRVHLVGGRFTDALALYLSVQLRILRPGVNHLQDQEANWLDQLLDMGARDVLVVFDIRRYQPSLLRLAERAAARGTRVVLITDQWLSPVSRVARHVLPARVAVPSMWDSNAALMAVGEALLAGVTRQLGASSRARIADLEKLRG
jgi:DNA-binding MurR/RpiR family transcriptional regulator